MSGVTVVKDGKKEIEFWLNGLSNPNVNRKSVELLNKCLQSEIHEYLNPIPIMKISDINEIDPYRRQKAIDAYYEVVAKNGEALRRLREE